MKTCSKCLVEKLETEFYFANKGGVRLKSECKMCSKARMKARAPAYYKANRARILARENEPENVRRHKDLQLQRSYGITVEQYDSMLAAQGGHCAICPATEPGGRFKHFSVDHDHATGEVRGLLCNNCNRAIGLLHDDPSLLRSAVNYLEQVRALKSA